MFLITRSESLLEQACESLEKLDELGVATLFWGDRIEPEKIEERLREVRGLVDDFQCQLRELEDQRQGILDNIGREEENLEILGADLYDILEEQERQVAQWVAMVVYMVSSGVASFAGRLAGRRLARAPTVAVAGPPRPPTGWG